MLNNNKKTPDSEFSIKVNKIEKLIHELTKIKHMSLNTGKYFISEKELDNKKYRRSIYIIKNIKKGQKFTEENIKCLRPNIGLPPKYFKHILKLRSPSELNYGDPITNKLYKKIKTYNK